MGYWVLRHKQLLMSYVFGFETKHIFTIKIKTVHTSKDGSKIAFNKRKKEEIESSFRSQKRSNVVG
jgi:hypothetical protein